MSIAAPANNQARQEQFHCRVVQLNVEKKQVEVPASAADQQYFHRFVRHADSVFVFADAEQQRKQSDHVHYVCNQCEDAHIQVLKEINIQ